MRRRLRVTGMLRAALLPAVVALAPLVAMSGCGDEPDNGNNMPFPEPITPTAPAGAPPAGDGGAAPINTAGAMAAPLPGQAHGPGDSGKEKLRAEVRQRKFKNEDFIEGDGNRDPFHSFLADFSGGHVATAGQHEILMPKYSLDEIKLGMVVGPPTVVRGDRAVAKGHVEPRAMFVDPTGFGVTVTRGKWISKADAKVVRIEPENGRVYVEMTEDLGNGKSRLVERVLELHPGEVPGATP